MKTIWKFPIKVTHGEQRVRMPEGAVILCAQIQSGEINVWAEVESDNKTEIKRLETFGTGWTIEPASRKYIGTVQEGMFVWHIYENL